MIVLSILLAVLLIALAAIMIRVVFKPQWAWLDRVIIAFVAIAIILGTLTVCMSAGYNGEVDRLKERHDDIVLYYDTINECRNEYVRFDFYERVQAYNSDYEKMVEDSNNIWIGKLFPHGWDTEFGTIDFALKTGYHG